MNAGRDVERLIADWFVEEAVLRAPDRILEQSGRVIDRTMQRRLGAAWRATPVSSMSRVASLAAVVGVLVVGGALLLRAGPNAGQSHPPPSPTTPATPVATMSASAPGPIPVGRYVADPIPVSGILAALDAETDLTDSDRATIVDGLLGIRGKSTLSVIIEVQGDEFTVSYAANEDPVVTDTWGLAVVDSKTIALTTTCCGVQEYSVDWQRSEQNPEADRFSLTPLTPTGAVESFVRRVLFQSSGFAQVR